MKAVTRRRVELIGVLNVVLGSWGCVGEDRVEPNLTRVSQSRSLGDSGSGWKGTK